MDRNHGQCVGVIIRCSVAGNHMVSEKNDDSQNRLSAATAHITPCRAREIALQERPATAGLSPAERSRAHGLTQSAPFRSNLAE